MFTNSRLKYSICLLLALCVASCSQQDSKKEADIQNKAQVGQSNDDKKIRLADPTIVYFGDQYYMYGTERPPQKGFPVLVSDDLKNWRIPKQAKNGYALKMGNQTFGTWGFWAPQVFKHNNQFYITYSADENIAFAHSDSPFGPFVQNEVRPLKEGLRQIDSFVFRDDDGKLYFYHVRLNKGNHIYVAEINEDFSSIKEETLTHAITPQSNTWEDTQKFESAVVAEGPTLIKHKDTYYLFYSTNHFMSEDYAVGYATSKSPMGPWKRYEKNPIIHRSVIGQKGTGHGDVLVGKNNQLYYVFHAHSTDTEVNPRATMIVPIRFKDVGQDEDIVEVDADAAFFPNLK